MLIFVNNKAISISNNTHLIKDHSQLFDQEFDLNTDIIEFKDLQGSVLIRNSDIKNIMAFIRFAQSNNIDKLSKIVFGVKDEKDIKLRIKKTLPVVKAAGGIVENKSGNILLMKRLGFWDLPKGKADDGENSQTTARREVEEECGVTVNVKGKICTTWHTYYIKNKLVIKRTKWYYMRLISDKRMKPQKEEGIEELKWMNGEEVDKAMLNSYASINHVIKKSGFFVTK